MQYFLLLCALFCALAAASPARIYAQGTQSQTIQFLPISDRAVNSAPFQIVALSSAYLPVTLQVQGPASLNGRLVTLTGVGQVTVTASQAGNADYAPITAQLSFQSLAVVPTVALPSVTVPYGTPASGYGFQPAAAASPYVDASADSTTITSQLDTSVLDPGNAPSYPSTSSVFRYEGTTVGPSPYPNDNSGYIANSTPYPYGLTFRIAFTCDCSEFEYVVQARGVTYRIWVDGAYTSPDTILQPSDYPQTMFVLVKFPDKRVRQIKITDAGNAPFFGINTANGDTVSAPQVPVGPQVMIFGDSWTGPTIVEPVIGPTQPGLDGSGYPQTLGEFFNWNYWDDGIGGSGFTVSGTDVLGRTFLQRIETDLCPNPFEAVLLLGGVNDGNATETAMQAAVSTALSEIQTCEAGKPLYLFGPQDYDQTQLQTAMAAAVAAAEVPPFYVDMGLEDWFYGSPTDPTTGNAYLYLNAHPTPLGHDFLAEMLAASLVHQFPELLPPPYTLMTPAPLAGVFSMSQLPSTPAVGSYPVTATFQPTDTAHFSQAGVTANLTITQATTATSETVNVLNSVATLTVSVSPQIAGTPTGSVNFIDNGTSIATAPLVNSVATAQVNVGNLVPGNQSVVASYSGDTNFLPSSAQMPVTFLAAKPDFSFSPGQTSVTVLPGASVTVPLAVSPVGGLSGPVSVQCSGLPANSSCTLTGTPTLSGAAITIDLVVQAFAPNALLKQRAVFPWLPRGGELALCCLIGCFSFQRRRALYTRMMLIGLVAATLCGAGLLSGCGSSSRISEATPGSYAVQVALTANAGGPAAVTHTQQITVNLP